MIPDVPMQTIPILSSLQDLLKWLLTFVVGILSVIMRELWVKQEETRKILVEHQLEAAQKFVTKDALKDDIAVIRSDMGRIFDSVKELNDSVQQMIGQQQIKKGR